MNATAGRHMALIAWMLTLLALVIFVELARNGLIHEAAWREDCETILSGGSVATHEPIHEVCHDLEERKARR
jgi:hypothetical protein